jgi:peptidyl-prolyl cis-trans isomerase A (cyclophilin A)
MRRSWILAGLLSAGCTQAPEPAPAPRDPELMKPGVPVPAPAEFRVALSTTQGEIVLRVVRAWAPRGVDRFHQLVRLGFYDGTRFFRVLPGFVVQWGLSGDPAVSAAWDPALLQDDPVRESNRAGRLSFATAGPNTRTTQVFVNLRDNVRLDRMGFAPFAEVVSGMDVFERLHAGYGEGVPQDRLTKEGEGFLQASFPKLDRIRSARILP